MAIITTLILLVPALIGTLCFEKFRGYELTWVRRAEAFLIFAFLINMSVYAVFWLRGWEFMNWSFSDSSSTHIIAVVVQYMALSLVASVVLAYVLSLVRIGKAVVESEDEDEGVSEEKVGDCGSSPQ